MRAAEPRADVSLLTADDLHLFNEGSHTRLWEKLGARPMEVGGGAGVHFATFAPEAQAVSVVGDFNAWNPDSHPLEPRGHSGLWERFVPGIGTGALYKFHVRSRHGGYRVDKTDPFAFFREVPPKTGSIVWDLEYRWNDGAWMAERAAHSPRERATSIYEVHLGSWMRPDGGLPDYRGIAPRLADYVKSMGFTHVELLPVMEHPFYGSWGYQSTGFFAPTSRYGTPQDLMFFIDHLHREGIGVILDWVPSHFPSDEHGLVFFDGSYVYEHADPRKAVQPDWGSLVFNYGRDEVRSFLLSSAVFWLEVYHADALRVDAVASMLYLDYSRKEGEWVPNRYGGRENLEAIAFLRRFNEEVYRTAPGAETIAEESTAWPMVTRPTWVGGLGFGMKWDMGWMHDTLEYMKLDPVHRKFHHDKLTFRGLYAFSENYLLPLSHDEVVHLKGSLLTKMPGDDWQRLANLRLLFGWMWAQPGKKLLFMGGEIGQWREWSHDRELDWSLLEHPGHAGLQKWVRDLNVLYAKERALFELDFQPAGFSWIDCADFERSVVALLRRGRSEDDVVAAAFNFTPVPRSGYRLGVPREGLWSEVANSDATDYGGSGVGNLGGCETRAVASHGYAQSIEVTLPPLGAVFLKQPVKRGDSEGPHPNPRGRRESEDAS
ncbi:MAG TPA: 1,4-alpha-glucan branching protein GlgB [Thermoanaerobaculia bacterium]